VFKPKQYRAKAAEYAEFAKATRDPDSAREFHEQAHSLTSLAENEQWLTDQHDKSVHGARDPEAGDIPAATMLAAEEEHVLRCLGAALIMQWNSLPRELQRELFDSAGSVGNLLDTGALRGQIARFLHRHKDDGDDVAADGTADTAVVTTVTEAGQGAERQQARAIARWDNEGGATGLSSGRASTP
jgi:hypothetical protein